MRKNTHSCPYIQLAAMATSVSCSLALTPLAYPCFSGLVKYALSNGQPANSVLMGISPLHAACSNGDEAIVRMLIENGADVNAPR